MRYILTSLLFFLFVISGNTQINFKYLTAENDFSDNGILTLYRDHKDYIWPGTSFNRLKKYDDCSVTFEYIFHVKASNNNGIWNTTGTLIKILPPWWKTWLFRILVICFIVSSIVVVKNYRTYRLRKQKLILSEKDKERTVQLEKVNTGLEEKQKEIFIKNTRLQKQKENLQKIDNTLEKQAEEIESQKNELNQHRNHLTQLVKERTADLETALEKVEESDRSKNAFLSNMSHEIRTPMNAIVGFSAMLSDLELPKNEREELVFHIRKNSEELLVLLDNILEMAQIQAGLLVVNNQPVNIIEIMNELVALFQLKAKSKGIKFTIDTGTFRDTLICSIDGILLKQIFSKLISNAIKFTEIGFVQFGIISQPKNYLTFYVKDSGIGIPKEIGNAIFKRFHKIDNTKTKIYEGVGLGLSIGYSLVKKMGGSIWYESKLEKGTTFYFTIPYCNNENNSISEGKNTNKSEILNLQGKRFYR